MWVNLSNLQNESEDKTYTLVSLIDGDQVFEWNISKIGSSMKTSLMRLAQPVVVSLGGAGASETTIDLTWTLGGAGSTTLTALRLEFRVEGDAVWSVADPAPGLTDTTYLLTGLVASTPYQLQMVKETDLGVVVAETPLSAPTAAPPVPGEYVAPWCTLKVHYDFSTSTFDEQVTGDPAYALTPSAGYAFEVYNGETWLHPVKRTEFHSYIGSLLPLRNFTWMARVNHTASSQAGTWWAQFGATPSTADYCDVIDLNPSNFRNNSTGAIQVKIQPDPTKHGYSARGNTELSRLRTSNTWTKNHLFEHTGTTTMTGSVWDSHFKGDHVFTIVFNANQTTGTDLATPVGTISTYVDNKLVKRSNITSAWLSLDHDFVFTSDRTFRLREDSENVFPFYIGMVKIFDGVVDMRMLNELPPLV
jgi:hypothetical protein